MALKRLLTTVGVYFDTFAHRIENHEAVAGAMIGDMKAAAAKLSVQKARNEKQLAHLREQL